MSQSISQTGMQGFLTWLKNTPQTASLYKSIRPQLSELLCVYPAGSSNMGTLTDSIIAAAPADAANSAALTTPVANLINGSCYVTSQTLQAIQLQLQQAQNGQAPLGNCQIGELIMGETRIRLGNTCFTFGTTELSGGTLLLLLALGAVGLGLYLFHRK